jgi:hypothetical protein
MREGKGELIYSSWRYLIKISIIKRVESREVELPLVARVAYIKGTRNSLIIRSFFQSLGVKISSSSSSL